jgi:hypothetical protein
VQINAIQNSRLIQDVTSQRQVINPRHFGIVFKGFGHFDPTFYPNVSKRVPVTSRPRRTKPPVSPLRKPENWQQGQMTVALVPTL